MDPAENILDKRQHAVGHADQQRLDAVVLEPIRGRNAKFIELGVPSRQPNGVRLLGHTRY